MTMAEALAALTQLGILREHPPTQERPFSPFLYTPRDWHVSPPRKVYAWQGCVHRLYKKTHAWEEPTGTHAPRKSQCGTVPAMQPRWLSTPTPEELAHLCGACARWTPAP